MSRAMQPGALDQYDARSCRARLLIVEDEISTVFAMREFFSFNGYAVDCAASITDALVQLDQSAYDVVITDLHLTPHRSAEGMSVVTRARRLNPSALIVMLTAYGSEDTGAEATHAGVNLFETKPVGLAKLASAIDALRASATQTAEPANGDVTCRK